MTGLLRSGSLFKKRQTTRAGGYQSWEYEEEGDGPLLGDEPTPARPLRSPDSALEEGGQVDIGVEASADLSEGLPLVECFYLGCHEMEGPIRGRGCIDLPAGELWERTQEDAGGKRRRSLRGSAKGRGGAASDDTAATRPRYVKLVAVKDELEMRDVGSGEKMASFSYRQISFVGTHPKYIRLFAFVAHARGCKVPSCYAFKCEDKLSACSTAEQLDGVFHQRCAELSRAHRSSPSPSSSSSLVAAL
jgi:hypothetical protein